MRYLISLLIFVLWGSSPLVYGQIQLVPLPQSAKIRSFSSARLTETDSLKADSIFTSIPFIEDFSSVRGRTPDTSKWEPDGGTHINNEMGDNPPSRNFATFDGFDAEGQPYNLSNPTEIDITDQLTSRYIDLSPYQTDDRFVISFFWQLQGAGEKPDLRDFLQLQFKDSTGNWVTQWQRQGGDSIPSAFTQEALFIQGNEFFHPDFQFRFRAQGRRSGSFDVWNLDYIYLDSGRNVEDTNYLDIAGYRTTNDYLSGEYQSIPYEHFFADRLRWIEQDSLQGLFSNLDAFFNILEYECAISDTVSGRFLGFLRVDSLLDRNTKFIDGETRNLALLAQPHPRLIIPQEQGQTRMVIAQQFRINTGEEPDFIPANDTVTTYTTLDDYYAYDDGTAEFAAGVNQRFGRLAYRYHIAEPDEMIGVDFYFPSVGESLQGQTFELFVWKSLDTASINPEDEILYREEVTFEATEGINTFTRHFFRVPVAVADTIFIGWEQLGEEMLVAGLDRNTDSGDAVFYNVANRWEQNTDIRGSLLFRPVFGERIVSAVQEEENTSLAEEAWQVFPNPATWRVRVRHPEGTIPERLQLFSVSGQLVRDVEQRDELALNGLGQGLYLLRIETKNGFFTKKLLVQP